MKRKPKKPITKVRTGMGDKGKTSFGGKVIDKNSSVLNFIGDIDEVCSVLGKLNLANIQIYQKMLFEISAMVHSDVAYEQYSSSLENYVETISNYIAEEVTKEGLTELTGFIIPTKKNADVMFARALVRRAERRAVDADVMWAIPILNAFSDYLFVMAWKFDASSQWTGMESEQEENDNGGNNV